MLFMISVHVILDASIPARAFKWITLKLTDNRLNSLPSKNSKVQFAAKIV